MTSEAAAVEGRGRSRTRVAVALLAGLAGFSVWELARQGSLHRIDSFTVWAGLVAVVLAAAAVGLAGGRWWARWLGLAVGVACTLYATGYVAISVLEWRHHIDTEALPFLLGPVLLMCLSGRTMFDRFDARAGWADDRRARLVRWTAITNIASLGSLMIVNLVFIYDNVSPSVPSGTNWISLAATTVLLGGVALLAAKKTAGVLAMGLGLVLMTVLFGAFCRIGGLNETAVTGFLVGLFLPGFATALAMFVVYARPMWRYLRAS
jgi:hypothetical protein